MSREERLRLLNEQYVQASLACLNVAGIPECSCRIKSGHML